MIVVNPKNKERLLRVKERILKEPISFDMRSWARTDDEVCGTVCCIAGWMYVEEYGMTDAKELMANTAPKVHEMFGLDWLKDDIPLFYTCDWDDDLKNQYYQFSEIESIKERREKQAQLAAEAIDRFIEKYSVDEEQSMEVSQ